MLLTPLVAEYGSENSVAMYNLTSSEAFLIIILVGVAGLIVQWRLRSVVSKYSKVMLPMGMTGAQIARQMLEAHGIYNVQITHTGGYLTDHFNPMNMTVNLSDEVYNGRSITAAAIACHECGHAVQHARGYAPLRMRSALVPLVNISAQFASWLVILGLIMTASTGSEMMCWIGVGLMCLSALFSIVTLPVEYNASERALAWLESSRTLSYDELDGAKVALRWAARTYLVAALSAIASILYYVALILGRRRD
jgi:Zn-dependent membrane protease YugP